MNCSSPADTISHMTKEEKEEAFKKDPKYGKIICRCETVTEAEIVDAIHAKVPALTIDSLKRRNKSIIWQMSGGILCTTINGYINS